MRTPFELPVEAQISVVGSDSYYITTTGHIYICGDISSKETADYIVQAINCHKLFREVAQYLWAHDGDTDLVNRTIEALKEAGEPK